jgi:L-fuculose-phosphate aldolase
MTDFDFERLRSEIIDGINYAAQSVSSTAKDISADVMRYKRFVENGRDLFVSGAVTSHGGNMSESNGESIWITQSGAMLGRISPSSIIETAWNTDSRDATASVELLVHRAIYHALAATQEGFPVGSSCDGTAQTCDTAEHKRGVVAAIIHAHPAHTIACSLSRTEIRPIDAEGMLLLGESVTVITPQSAVASPEAASMMADVVSNGARIAVIAGHGPFAVASDLETAFKLISCLERSCQILNIPSYAR